MTNQMLAVKATATTLSKRMTMEQAFQAIAINCLMQMTSNRDGITQQHDVESVHQMRVGLRRLRTLLALFKETLPVPALLLQELAWLGTQLGAARDWDVLAGSTLPAVAKKVPGEEGLESVALAAQALADERHALATAALQSTRYADLIERGAAWIKDCGWRDAMTARQRKRLSARVTGCASAILLRQHSRLLERGNKLRGASAENRHRIRIAAKKMRYACEFFQGLYPDRKMAPYLAGLARLQDTLGWLNDAAVAGALLNQLQDQQPELAGSAGFVRGYLAARLLQGGKQSIKRWKKFTPIALPRSIASA
jgi:CHAD domain-containing protein